MFPTLKSKTIKSNTVYEQEQHVNTACLCLICGSRVHQTRVKYITKKKKGKSKLIVKKKLELSCIPKKVKK